MSRAPAVPAAVQAAFDRFWAAYPPRRDNPKKPALKAFVQLVTDGAEPEALVRAAGAFAAHVKSKGFDAQFTPHARTWLAQERFEEWMTTEVPASAQRAAGPNPEHPLAPLYPQIGAAAWASYVAPLTITISFPGARIEAPTRTGLDRLRQNWGREIEAQLGRVMWAVRS
ncbi:MAG: hypothetical protein P0Y50_08830 [Candidatus Brevundimonas colombiensis]|uniref:Uncharacterized protein n=1 Tax=Candidatus Brevundimonas colombiensis TaxID=3121376 RepID=A0AAJ5WWS5_9CAUL|nr:hypothetical protein [Brevundimonas sp.]WEK38656.1 MAG: hypothetical protein P0Y50_08830 [Brevundimonas sp.]